MDSYLVAPATDSAPRTLTIKNEQTPVTVTIKVGDLTKTYGDEDPEYPLTASVMQDGASAVITGPDASGNCVVTVTDSQGGKTISFTVSREEGENVGVYTITPSGNALQEGYRVLFETGTLTVSPAEVTITAGASKVYGEDDPALVTVTGLKNNDTAGSGDSDTVKYTVFREEGENVGDYPITLTGESDQGNYRVIFDNANATFTITRASATVTAKAASKVYGEDDPELTAAVDGLQRGDEASVLTYELTREAGENVGTYSITPAGEAEQGNYAVTYAPAEFTITPAALTVKVADTEKTYGDEDPEWEAEIDGLYRDEEGGTLNSVLDEVTGIRTYTYTLGEGDEAVDLLTFTVTREPGEGVGSYTVTPAGAETQGNYTVTFESGTLSIERAELIVTADHVVKAVGVETDPLLTATVTGWKNGDDPLSETTLISTETGEDGTVTRTYRRGSGAAEVTFRVISSVGADKTVTWTYKRGEDTLLTFTLNRDPGEEEGEYPITVSGGQNQSNYSVEYEQGSFGILSILDVDVKQPVIDYADTDAAPSYTYTAKLDLTGTGLVEYEKNGFTPVDGVPTCTFTLPDANKADTMTLKVPGGAKLTVEQTSTNDDYNTALSIDGNPYTDPNNRLLCILEHVDTYHEMAFTHSRISYPVEARVSETQSEEGAKKLEGRKGAMGIPTGDELTREINTDFADDMHSKIGYVLPTDKYYMYDHASLYTTAGAAVEGAFNVSAIKYDRENGKWQYKAGEGDFVDVPENTQLVLFYLPRFVCKIETEKFYSLKSAVEYAAANNLTATIEMLIGDYTIRSSNDAVTIPEGYDITITTASTEYEGTGTAVISRSASYTAGHLFYNDGSLTFDNIILDGKNVQATDALVLNRDHEPTLNINSGATLRNASGNNGGAIYVESGIVTVNGTLSGNTANSGGAVFANNGKLILNSRNITDNRAENGGTIYMNGGEVELNGTVSVSMATNGGGVYMTNGALTVSGSMTGNSATDGGALYQTGGTATVSGSMSGNAAANNGGALYQTGGTATVSGSMSENAANNSGAVYQAGSSTLNNTGTIRNNTAANGGAVYLAAGTFNQTDGSLTGNEATGNGGAIYGAGGTVSVSGGSVTGNAATINGGAIYTANAYSFATTATRFEQFLSAINWDSEGQRWDFIERDGSKTEGNPGLKIYYSNGAYISIVNNSAYDLTVDSMTVLGKTVPFYGYPTVKNNITLDTLAPVTGDDLVLKSGENVKLLFPGAVNRDWSITGTFKDPTTGEPVGNAPYMYTVDRTHGGEEQSGTTDADGKIIALNGKTNNTAGGAIEVLFGNPTYICKVTDASREHVKLRVEMVKSHYAMKGPATLATGHYVTLGTALKTDRLFPYPTDADSPAVVTRGFDGGSMIVDKGSLTFDTITLDGGGNGFKSTEKGGIVQVNGAQTLTVTENATLRNSVSEDNGGAIWISQSAGLVMNGTIENCRAKNGGGVYAENGFGGGETGRVGVSVSGTITGCTATAGNGGALHVGTAADLPDDAVPVTLTSSARLTGNSAVCNGEDESTGRGGAVYSATALQIDSAVISDNIAAKDGGGVFLDEGGSLTMSGGTISGNVATAGHAGGIWAQNITITGGLFANNKAENGFGGAIYTKTNSHVEISGENTSFSGNAAMRGGAVYDQAASFTMSAGSMTGNTATEKGGAVYVAGANGFDMSGGSISGNSSPEGAISTGQAAVLNFSGSATVTGNTGADGTTAMNVFLGHDTNAIINASGLTGSAPIGVYVKDGEGKVTYYNHGIANRPFGTGTSENLNRFVNDRNARLTGVQGPGGLIMWPGKDLEIKVVQNTASKAVVGGAKFRLVNEDGVTVWYGESDASGMLTIPWVTEEQAVQQPGAQGSQTVGGATFTKKDADGNVTEVSYVLTQLEANADTVRPAGSWTLTVKADNEIKWTRQTTKLLSKAGDAEDSASNKDRTLELEAPEGSYLGATFLLYDDVKPRITFDPNGGRLAGRTDSGTRTDTIEFGTKDTSFTYTITESAPTKDSSVFRVWSTVKNPVDGDGHKEYKRGDNILFYRHTEDDDLTLYALWNTVVCKITDRDDKLLYVNGSPAVYMTLKDGFDAFNTAAFTRDGVRATPRKIKMLVGSYEMTETVTLARGKIAEFTTAPSTDNDGYAGPANNCVITRAASFDSGSMIEDKYNLVIRDITLDGGSKTVSGNGGIVSVLGSASHLTLASGAVLRNAEVTGDGGAIYAYAENNNTTVIVSEGSTVKGCKAKNGGAIFGNAVTVSGGEVSGNKAENGAAIYANGAVNLTGGAVKNNTATENGGGVYLTESGSLSMRGGSLTGNTAENGGGVYSNGAVRLENNSAVISGNTATASGGGVYVTESGRLTMTAGSIGASGSRNAAASGSSVYLAGSAALTGGKITYNGTTDSENGGGLYIVSKSEITLGGTEISYNRAASGGAIYAANAPENAKTTVTLAKGAVKGNTASESGGGVYLSEMVTFQMTGGSLEANTAKDGGGAYVTGTMTVSGGTVKGNKTSDGNGGAVYVKGDAELNVENGAISENSAQGLGGAVYLEDKAQMAMSGGSVTANTASETNGGAVNVGGAEARIYLSGKPTLFNNPGRADTRAQKNLVLSEDSNAIINTTGGGLTGGTVGIYVIDALVDKHGVYNKPFGTFGNKDENRVNAEYLVNDRDLALYGVTKGEGDDTIYWLDVVCKVTNGSKQMLYKNVTVNGILIKASGGDDQTR